MVLKCSGDKEEDVTWKIGVEPFQLMTRLGRLLRVCDQTPCGTL